MGGPRIFWIVASLLLVAATQGAWTIFVPRKSRVVRRLRQDLAALPGTARRSTIEAEGDDYEIDPKVLNVLGRRGR
ncbi:MAG: hypothetical protein U0992_24560 [Planctomycetaceae bacterium]